MTEQAFDWRTETTRRGTQSRLGQYVYADCARCPQTNVLVYDATWDEDAELICADCYRRQAHGQKKQETCDNGDGRPAWRDPLSGKNEFFCAQCHASNGTVFQNRWADRAREGRVLGLRDRPVCELADRGTACKGEIKWRGGPKMSLCNHHAGVTSSGPEWHQ